MLGSLYVAASRSKQVRSIESFFCVFYRVFLREVLRLSFPMASMGVSGNNGDSLVYTQAPGSCSGGLSSY